MENPKWGKTMLSNPAPSDKFFQTKLHYLSKPGLQLKAKYSDTWAWTHRGISHSKVTAWKNEGDGQEVNTYLYWLFSAFFSKFCCLLKLMESFLDVRKYILWKLKSPNWLKTRTINKTARLAEKFTKLSGCRAHSILNTSSTILVGLPLNFINCR